ncbi:MAG: hypothetical protein EKK37_17420 [Sphingobacteriales bacterium]|nr:MAG: hypothetical protein EKK37_17420 [Sphingobacteriales bacterium]
MPYFIDAIESIVVTTNLIDDLNSRLFWHEGHVEFHDYDQLSPLFGKIKELRIFVKHENSLTIAAFQCGQIIAKHKMLCALDGNTGAVFQPRKF